MKLRWYFIDCDNVLSADWVDQGLWQSLASYKGMQTLHQGKWYHLYSSLQLVQTDKMIVAITGATGFIGLRLVKRFDAGSSESCAFDEASPSAKDYLGEVRNMTVNAICVLEEDHCLKICISL
jgi:hypothetical protein